MTTDILVDAGEEYLMKNGFDATTFIVGLYNDATDGITDTDSDPSTAITTEPSNANYARQNATMTAADISGNWGVDNDSQISFDFSDQTASYTVDAAFMLVNFNSTEGGTTGDWIVATAALSQGRDIGSVDTIDFAAGDLEVTVN